MSDHDDLKILTDEELDEHRRAVLLEQERRQKLEDGEELIGQVVRDYLEAAGLVCPDLTNVELGQRVISLL